MSYLKRLRPQTNVLSSHFILNISSPNMRCFIGSPTLWGVSGRMINIRNGGECPFPSQVEALASRHSNISSKDHLKHPMFHEFNKNRWCLVELDIVSLINWANHQMPLYDHLQLIFIFNHHHHCTIINLQDLSLEVTLFGGSDFGQSPIEAKAYSGRHLRGARGTQLFGEREEVLYWNRFCEIIDYKLLCISELITSDESDD